MGIVYNVEKASPDWKVTFALRTRVRHHTSPNFAPSTTLYIDPPNSIIVKPGQWLEGMEHGGWSLLVDADHR